MNFLKTIIFWLKAARVHTLPMSFMSWLVVFCWAVKHGGNITLGIIALFGILLAQLGVNLIDDCFDYKKEIRKTQNPDEIKNIKMQKSKCKYMIDGKATLKQSFIVSFIYFGLAALIGIVLFFICGWQVILIAALAAILCILYPLLTYIWLGEFAVWMTFAPLLFMGVSFVMLGYFSKDVLILSISTGLLTIGLLHTHALLDFDFDVKNNKKTLCTLLGSKKKSLIMLSLIMSGAYINIALGVLLGFFPVATLITFLTIPLAVTLYKFMKLNIEHPEITPERKLWMGPMENWEELKADGSENFTLKIYLSRNIMIFFTILLCASLLLS